MTFRSRLKKWWQERTEHILSADIRDVQDDINFWREKLKDAQQASEPNAEQVEAIKRFIEGQKTKLARLEQKRSLLKRRMSEQSRPSPV
ncbi:MAG: hypothetical protein KBD16_02310 [Candidatus Pacebacteria bacterium]|nr:hypothetical protein [Candidatus Paceibacterota bacterium]